MRLKVIDPEYPSEISIETAGDPVLFTAVFRRIGRKEQSALLDIINGWSIGDLADDVAGKVANQEWLIKDLAIRFEGLPVDEPDDEIDVSLSVKSLIRDIIIRKLYGAKLKPEDVDQGEIQRQLDQVLSDPLQLRFYQELELVLDDTLVFSKVLNGAIRAVVNAGVERSKN